MKYAKLKKSHNFTFFLLLLVRCWSCKRKGHPSKECPYRKEDSRGRGRGWGRFGGEAVGGEGVGGEGVGGEGVGGEGVMGEWGKWWSIWGAPHFLFIHNFFLLLLLLFFGREMGGGGNISKGKL